MTIQQLGASNPKVSAWVTASAGTGKTKVLIDRLLRLLLEGADPKHILCLTFTRAASAELINRITHITSEWVSARDKDLIEDLGRLLQREPNESEITCSRQLMGRILENPRGMNVQTIHAYCQSLLQRFPIEAGISPQFTVADERTTQEFLIEAQNRLFAHSRYSKNSELISALSVITTQIGETRFSSLLSEIISERNKVRSLLIREKTKDNIHSALGKIFGVEQGDTEQSLLLRNCNENKFDFYGLTKAADVLCNGTRTDLERGTVISEWLASDILGRAKKFDRYCSQFLTKGNIKGKTRLASKTAQAEMMDIQNVLRQEQVRLLLHADSIRAFFIMKNSTALIYVVTKVLHYFEEIKREHGVLDYDDQIFKSCELLSNPNIAPWVMYKLDGGLEHILIDESQDTSASQWLIVKALSQEFFSGENAHDIDRTIFAVGDKKQSIFSFQGADPILLDDVRSSFSAMAKGADRAWREIPLDTSFRSTAPILALVDKVFSQEEAAKGVVPSGESLQHHIQRLGESGIVEVWPTCVPITSKDDESWAPPTTRQSIDDVENRLANTIAKNISDWTQGNPSKGDPGWLDSKNRPITPADIMVLVRRRSKFISYLVNALKSLQIPVSGADKLVLTDQLAIMDLMALGDFILFPDDDLTLAGLLKGPFIGLSEEELYLLAWQRGCKSLWTTLISRKDENERFKQAYDCLMLWLNKADLMAPYEFYAEILGCDGGRAALLRSIGNEAAEQIEEFLTAIIRFERFHPPSLQHFLHWLRTAKSKLESNFEHKQEEVRVMTVHGAKGLQAPIIFLPDTVSIPQDKNMVLWSSNEDGIIIPLWPGGRHKEEKIAKSLRSDLRQRQLDEYRRLLYVAMTRAEDRLYVCGWHRSKLPADECWYSLIRAGLNHLEGVTQHTSKYTEGNGWRGTGLRITSPQTVDLILPHEETIVSQNIGNIPFNIRSAPPKESRKLELTLPSWQNSESGIKPSETRDHAVCKLIELLTKESSQNHEKLIKMFFSQSGNNFDSSVENEIRKIALKLIEDEGCELLFGPKSQSNFEVAAIINHRLISVRIDRVLIEEDKVVIIDFISDWGFSKDVSNSEDISKYQPQYFKKIAGYKSVFRSAFSDCRICCVSVLMKQSKIIWLPDELLNDYSS